MTGGGAGGGTNRELRIRLVGSSCTPVGAHPDEHIAARSSVQLCCELCRHLCSRSAGKVLLVNTQQLGALKTASVRLKSFWLERQLCSSREGERDRARERAVHFSVS